MTQETIEEVTITEEGLEKLMGKGTRVTMACIAGEIGYNGCDVEGFCIYFQPNSGVWGTEVPIRDGHVLEWTDYSWIDTAPNCSYLKSYRVRARRVLAKERK